MPLQTWVTNQVLTSADMNVVGRQSIAVVTSVTRPASPVEGQTIYETDTDKFVCWDGAAWQEVLQAGAWTTFTPTISQVSARTTSTNSFAYARVGGKCVEFSGAITITNAGTAGNKITMSLPVATNARYVAGTPIGTAMYNDLAAWRVGTLVWDSTTTAAIQLDNLGNVYGIAPSIATANGHKFLATARYEIA